MRILQKLWNQELLKYGYRVINNQHLVKTIVLTQNGLILRLYFAIFFKSIIKI
jgi:hypothetical protein